MVRLAPLATAGLLFVAAAPPAPGRPREEPPVPAAAEESPRARLLRTQREAAELLERVAEIGPRREDARGLLGDAARRIQDLAESGGLPAGPGTPASPLLPRGLCDELRRAAAELGDRARADPSDSSVEPYLRLLRRVAARLGEAPLGLTFQGSYSQTKVAEPVYGGHASAMGPPPAPAPPREGAGPSPVQLVEGPALPVKTWCGGATKDHILESGGSGLALLDYDGDGRLDLYLVTAPELTADRARVPHRNALFRNRGGWRFDDVSAAAGVDAAAWGSGVCAGDVDGDGRLDLYVTNWGPNLLYRNRGDGSFEETAARAGVQAPGWSTGCTFFDADADGDLDLYVAGYVATTEEELRKAERTLTWRGGPRVMVGPAGLPGEADLFFENRGDGTFAEATDRHGLTDTAPAYGFGVVATDYDDDGWVDLHVANDSNPDFLYRNRGDGTFESTGLLAGAALDADGRAQAGMGVDSGDYDGDGRLDLVVTNFAHDTDTLRRNVDGAQFEDATRAAGLAAPTFERMGWGVAFLDVDLDGDLDLFTANGHIYPNVEEFPELRESLGQANQLFVNEGDGTFRDVSEGAGEGMRVRKASRGLAVGDLDGDGDLDLVVGNMDDAPTLLENRPAAGRHWVGFRLEQRAGNRFGIGARVTLRAGGRSQVREVRSGGGYLSQGDLLAHFGLGPSPGTVDVEVRLPGGRRWTWSGLVPDRVHRLLLE